MANDDIRICFVGDSFVQGTCDPFCLGWAGRVASSAHHAGYDLTYYNLGVRRDTSSDIAARWKPECSVRLVPASRRYIVFSFGVNDTTIENGAYRVVPSKSRAHFRTIVGESSATYTVAVVGPPPTADASQNVRIRSLSAAFAEEARQLGVPYLSIVETLEKDPVWMSDVVDHDGSHPGARGYARLAELVLQWPEWWFKS